MKCQLLKSLNLSYELTEIWALIINVNNATELSKSKYVFGRAEPELSWFEP